MSRRVFKETFVQGSVQPLRGLATLWFVALACLPRSAWALDIYTVLPGGAATWSTATVAALVGVAALGIVSYSSFHLARVLRWVPRDREIQISRTLQVVFGALLLVAATLPYFMLNFPVATTILLGSGVLAMVGCFVGKLRQTTL